MQARDARRSSSGGQSVQVRIIVADEIEQTTETISRESLKPHRDDVLVWVDLVHPDDAILETLRDVYDLHPLAASAVTTTHHASSISSFKGTVHLAVRYPRDHGEFVSSEEIQVMVGKGFVITIHEPGILDFESVHDRWTTTPDEWRSTSTSLLYAVLGTAMARIGPIADCLEESLEHMQARTLDPANRGTPKRDTLYHVFDLTEQITDLHNIMLPLKEVTDSLVHNSEWFGEEQSNAYTRSVYDDIVRMTQRIDALRQTGQRLFEMVNSLITLQRTDVSKQLTLIVTIFLPLSFLASYFGQNFRYMEDAIMGLDGFLIWGIGAQLLALVAIFGVLWKFDAFR